MCKNFFLCTCTADRQEKKAERAKGDADEVIDPEQLNLF